MWRRLKRQGLAMIGDDGTGLVWKRLTPPGREVVRLAFLESRELGHPCLADEHVMIAVLRHDASAAAALLRSHGLDVDSVRAGLARVGPTLSRGTDPAVALRSLGIDVEAVRGELEQTFGPEAVQAAERRVRRRPRWRGGHARPSPLCAYVLAKRSFEFAGAFADQRGDAGIGPEHLLYGVLRDARDPLGTQLSRRTRRTLDALGWSSGRANPVRLVVEARGLDLDALAAGLP
jgi:hypothetical protein